MREKPHVILDRVGDGFFLERLGASAFCFYNHQGEVVGEFKFTEKFLQILFQGKTSFVGILGLTEFQ